jgi:hypothetical protein
VVEAARKHSPFDKREWRTTPTRLNLVPTEHVSVAVELVPEEAGTRRLLGAVAADPL